MLLKTSEKDNALKRALNFAPGPNTRFYDRGTEHQGCSRYSPVFTVEQFK